MEANRFKYSPLALCAIFIAILFVGLFIIAAAHENVDDVKARVESRYGFRLDLTAIDEYSDGQKKRFIDDVDKTLKKIPQELHDRLIIYFRLKEITIELKPFSDSKSGIYNHDIATITLYGNTESLLHEYGLMLVHAIFETAYFAGFEREWQLINRSGWKSVEYSEIAEVFAEFVEAYAGRTKEKDFKRKTDYEKAMLLERVARPVLNVDGIFIR